MSKVDEQIQLEMQSVTRGEKRFYENLVAEAECGREFDGPVGSRFIGLRMATLVPAIKSQQRSAAHKLRGAYTSGRRLGGWEAPIRALSADELAYITIRAVLANGSDTKWDWIQLARKVGTMCNEQVWFNQLTSLEKARRKEEGADPSYNRITILKSEVKRINPRAVRKWRRVLSDLETETWDNKLRVKLGLILLEVTVGALPETFEFREIWSATNGRMSSKKYVVTTEAAEAELDKSYRTFAAERPWLVPMVCKPRDWTHNYGGGYLRFRLPFVKDKSWRMKGDSVPSKESMDAVNTMQATPWAINSDVYEIALLARDRGLEEILPVAPVRPMPERLPDEEFAALDREGRSALSLKRRSIHDHNNRLESRRKTMRRQLEVAREFEMQPAIYFPHCVDFRGRAYPLPQDLHPQSDDFGRGLLVFAERKQLGEHGLEWLCYHLANTYGIDKEDRPAQLEWVRQHEDWISTVAVDPLGAGFEFLAAAEEPWQFLAAAIEFDKAIQLQAPGEYWSNLPVAVDGSCNGLQHLSAMGLDPVGARAVNLTNAPRQDIYGIVADKVDGMVEEDARDIPDPTPDGWARRPSDKQMIAVEWLGHVTRKTVKRGVMTVPYGLTDAGMADQLIADRHTDGLAGDPKVNAQYLRDRMKEALEDTVEKATEIMEWMQYNAKVLTEANVPVEWYTPSGFMVHQGYYKSRPATFTIFGIGKEKRVGVQLQDRDDDAGLMPTKQKLAVAPNIIHSFDAAHMVQAVNALPRGTAVAVVHDSYATHACDVPEMVGTLKRTFVEIYEQDWFESLQRDFQACAERAFEPVRLLPPPERGEFDINEVHNAEYFFA